VSYVGSQGHDLITQNDLDAVPPGQYDDLQAAKPYPALGGVLVYQNIGKMWYNALMLKMEKRFGNGLSYLASYAFGKTIGENADSVWGQPTPFAPAGYNRGRSSLDRTHILTVNGIYELPVGKSQKYLSGMNSIANAILGDWQIAGIYAFTSGTPLTFGVPGGTLGNGYGTRAIVTGDLSVSNPSASEWFNPAVLSAPPDYTYGSSGIGIFDGPGVHSFDTSLSKKFMITEDKYFQFRWEMFNMPNHVNLSNPNTTQGQSSTGQIFSAGNARTMQFGLKFVF
jgi:hypothetical protein